MDPMDDLDPQVRAYLTAMQEQQGRSQGAQDEINTRSYNRQVDNSMMGGIAGGLAQMGAIGGKVASTAPLESALNNMSAAQATQTGRQIGGLQRSSDQQGKVYQYLMDKREKDLSKQADVGEKQRAQTASFGQQSALQKEKFGQERDLLGIKNKADLELAKNKSITPDKSVAKAQEETDYRVNSMKQNAQKLKDIIAKEGTVSVGTPGASMDSLIYQMAIDFAKASDPESVAREGEVASAQKYMLPIRNLQGMRYSNEQAQELVDNYIKDLETRVQSRTMAKSGQPAPYQFGTGAKPDTAGTAIAAPDQSAEAISWLNANPTHPKSSAIREKLKAEGKIK